MTYPIEKARNGRSGAEAPRLSRLSAGRMPPQASDLERAILGAMLMSPEAAARAAELLRPGTFYLTKHSRIFEALFAAYTRDGWCNLVLATEELRRQQVLDDVGGAYYLTDVATEAAPPELIDAYARILLEKEALRSMIERFTVLAGRAYDPTADAFDLLSEAEAELSRIVEATTESEGTSATGDELLRLAERDDNSIPTGLVSLDDKVGGYAPGRITLLIGRTSHGKTSLALDLTLRMAARCRARRQGHVVYFSCEMSRERAAKRILSMRSRAFMQDLPLTIDDFASPDTARVLARLRSTERQWGEISLFVFDYIDYTGEEGASARDVYRRAYKGLHAAAKRHSCPALVLSQTNRAIDKRGDTEPQLDDVNEFGEQPAAMVLACYHEWMHWRQRGRQGPEPDRDRYLLSVLKNTHGGVGVVDLRFDRQTGRFTDPEESRLAGPSFKPF